MSQRNATAAVLAALASNTKSWAILYEGIFTPGGVDTPLRLWTGRGTLSWGGNNWLGAGQFLAFSPIEEVLDIQAVNFTVSLSGLASGIIDLAENSIKSGKPGKLWLAMFDTNGLLIADPYPLRRGRFDTDTIQHDGQTCTITVQYESVLAALDRPRERRWTSEDQQIDYPGDKGFDQVPSLQDKTFTWG
jgi:hypothetical protein